MRAEAKEDLSLKYIYVEPDDYQQDKAYDLKREISKPILTSRCILII